MGNEDYKTRCLYQGQKRFMPQYILEQKKMGNCETCTHDPENNKKCLLYYPIPIKTFEIKESDIEKKSKSL